MVIDASNGHSATVPSGVAGGVHDKVPRDLGVGTAWLAVLAAIAASPAPVHGYELARTLSASAPEGTEFKHGTLYPMLRTMEAQGLISSVLVPSNEGPARKVYHLTPRGGVTLEHWRGAWQRTQLWLNGLLGGTTYVPD